MDVAHFLQTCGIFGILILLITVILLAAILIVSRIANRKAIIILAAAGLLPLFIGSGGTALGYQAVDQTVAAMGQVPAEIMERDLRAARYPFWLGSGCTLVLWLVALVGLALQRKPAA